MKKILVIQTRVGIGDLCVFLPCIHQIAKKNKDFELHLLTKKRSSAKDFLKYDKHVKKIFYLPETSGIILNFFIFEFLITSLLASGLSFILFSWSIIGSILEAADKP